MRNIERDKPYQAANWICHRILPTVCRSVTGLPWPVLDGLPRLEGGGRRGAAIAAELYPVVQGIQSAVIAALGPEHPLTELSQLATVIVNVNSSDNPRAFKKSP